MFRGTYSGLCARSDYVPQFCRSLVFAGERRYCCPSPSSFWEHNYWREKGQNDRFPPSRQTDFQGNPSEEWSSVQRRWKVASLIRLASSRSVGCLRGHACDPITEACVSPPFPPHNHVPSDSPCGLLWGQKPKRINPIDRVWTDVITFDQQGALRHPRRNEIIRLKPMDCDRKNEKRT